MYVNGVVSARHAIRHNDSHERRKRTEAVEGSEDKGVWYNIDEGPEMPCKRCGGRRCVEIVA